MRHKIFNSVVFILLICLLQFDLRQSLKRINLKIASMGVYFYFTILLLTIIVLILNLIEMWVYDISFIKS